MAYKLWRLQVEGVTYTVQMHHRLFSGDLHIVLDGKTVFLGRRGAEYETAHNFRLPNWWSGAVQVSSIGMDFYYQLWLEGRVVSPERDEDTLLRASTFPEDGLLRPVARRREDETAELLRPLPVDTA
jgi:hypothetical protein